MTDYTHYANQIRDLIKMSDIFDMYGFKRNRNGAISCPFHSEKTPSLKTYKDDTFYHCFGCGEHGGIIDFVMRYFNLNFAQAILRLNYDFRLNLTYAKPTYDKRKELEERKRAKAQLEAEKDERLKELLSEHGRLWDLYLITLPKNDIDEVTDEFVYAANRLPYVEYLIEMEQAI